MRPHRDKRDDKLRIEKFIDSLECIQHNAQLAITVDMKGTSNELHNQPGLEYLRDRQWMQRLCLFHQCTSAVYYHQLLVFILLEITQISYHLTEGLCI